MASASAIHRQQEYCVSDKPKKPISHISNSLAIIVVLLLLLIFPSAVAAVCVCLVLRVFFLHWLTSRSLPAAAPVIAVFCAHRVVSRACATLHVMPSVPSRPYASDAIYMLGHNKYSHTRARRASAYMQLTTVAAKNCVLPSRIEHATILFFWFMRERIKAHR